ncbi:MAG: SurA N-terminal domain-containing protein [Alphaproteobacteria bacterium]|nr:SurA N-terminal domain-containing protein [Alphaproteobacteria bacterium]MDX5370154.1 SurA N-terminal domain-containing protein [Alphaproteobacteria bacterium]MDX5464711.1 SurA N-terminal domain-containing protein [Alphaproteobacteria bacterium]
MLDQMRKFAGGWVAGIFIVLLAASFAVWGVGDMLRGSTPTTVATVGETPIEAADFLRELDRERQQLSQQLGRNILPGEAVREGLDGQVLERMIDRTVLDVMARQMGLDTPDSAVATYIRTLPAFQGLDGTFNRTAFETVLRRTGMSEQAFLESVRADLTRQQLLGIIGAEAEPALLATSALNRYAREGRTLSAVVIPASAAGEVAAPTEEELAEFHAGNEQRFTAPEYRAVTLVAFGPQDLASQIEVPEEDIAALYETRKQSYTVPERRTVQQMLFDTQEAAQAAAARLQLAADFDQAIADLGFAADDISLGTVTKAELPDGVADAAFGLDAPGVTSPIESPFGWAILRVSEILPGDVTPLADVRELLRTELALERARDELYEISNVFEDRRAGGETLEEAASALDLPVYTVDAVDARGLGKDGQAPEGFPRIDGLLQAVFESDVGLEEPINETADGVYWVFRVDGIEPSRVKPLEEVRDRVAELVTAQKRQAALAEKAQAHAEAVRKGEATLDDVASDVGAGVQEITGLTRLQPKGPVSGEVLDRVFEAAAEGVVTGPAAGSDGYLLARVTGISVPEGESATQAAEARQAQLSSLYVQELVAAYIADAKAALEVSRNPVAIRAALNSYGAL